MKRLKSMTVNQVLKSYSFPRKFYVRYALDCAYTVKHLMEDPRSLKALEVTELWLQGKATQEEVKVAAAASSAAATYAATYAAHAAAATYASTAATYAASYAASYTASYACSTAAAAASSRNILDTTLKDILLKQIETLSEFQRLMLGIEV